MESVRELEKLRTLGEEIELHMEELITEVKHVPTNHRTKLHHEHFIAERLELMKAKKRRLVEIYTERNERENEVQPLGVVERQFYDGIQGIQQHYVKFPKTSITPLQPEQPAPDKCRVQFSGEEGYGRYLDLHEVYNLFLGLSFVCQTEEAKGKTGMDALMAVTVAPIDYIDWLQRFHMFQKIPRKSKNKQYSEYLDALLNYLKEFYVRTQPLSMDVETMFEEGRLNFAERWGTDGVLGWEDITIPPATTGKKLTKSQRLHRIHRQIAETEELIQRLYDMLKESIDQTIVMLERKETRSKEELLKETEREEAEAQRVYEENYKKQIAEDKKKAEDDDIPGVKNQRNLPLGYDGQPIPFWLYRLHGLNMKFPCEICRGFEYVGPKAFDKHFQEPRHAHGMRCLGIPNTVHFHHVVGIQEALSLWKKIRTDVSDKRWNANDEQEHEDNEGHVFSRKTRDDLRSKQLL
eukprot:TRINITY_DN31008_c0_g1_i1.p1 TRINITY_DN31008_c0_g1~~TRINITY_DN31008_c0_g1_i1.p1  ORF type:complete len:479 (+),score=101.45 TRINITY_DN31008_c0_g1_i1:43-1437(+)